jgi:hypothetical protein
MVEDEFRDRARDICVAHQRHRTIIKDQPLTISSLAQPPAGEGPSAAGFHPGDCGLDIMVPGLYGDPHLRDQIHGLKLQESELTTSIDALKKRRSLGSKIISDEQLHKFSVAVSKRLCDADPSSRRPIMRCSRRCPLHQRNHGSRVVSTGVLQHYLPHSGDEFSIRLPLRREREARYVQAERLAVLRLITNSNVVGCSTGRSAGTRGACR